MSTGRALLLMCAISAGVAIGVGPSDAQNAPDRARFVPNELIVKYRYGTSVAEKSRALARANARAIQRLTRTPAAAATGDLELVRSPLSVGEAVARVSQDPRVQYAEPNWIYTTDQNVPNDPSFGQLWGLHNTGQTINGEIGGTPDADIDAPEAWAATIGSTSVYVGVIDEGIDISHADLAGQIWINSFDLVDGVDNDGNGYLDDAHGWDFANGDNSVYDGNGKTSVDAHGTHVAGTIGASANNGIGVAGVNWNVRIIPAKFLGRNGGTTANAILAVDYLTDLKMRHGLNIVATSNSWGGGGFSQGLLEAIARGANANILFVAAAGNGDRRGNGIDNDAMPHYPANYSTAGVAGATYDAVISVAATGRSDEIRPWSNYGATTVDLGAPGSLILSTVPGSKYAYYSGTSMATPHVTGVAALVNAGLAISGGALRDKILGAVDPTPALAGKTVTGGRLNAYNAVTATP